MTRRPIIGITCGEIRNNVETWASVVYGQSTTYSDAVVRAGGVPILLPITSDTKVLRAMYEVCEGLLFAGGNDLDPAHYNQVPYPETQDISLPRDKQEFDLIAWSLRDQKPLLAICRGMQALNVACGGTLYQHLPTDILAAQNHQASKQYQDTTYIAHILHVEPDSRLAAILGTETIRSNSQHHQAVHERGTNVSVTAYAEDGIIEAIEIPSHRFAIGVQPHPEGLEMTVEPRWRKLFEAFIAVSSDRSIG